MVREGAVEERTTHEDEQDSRAESALRTLRLDARPLVGSALRVQHPVLGYARPVEAQRRRRLYIPDRPLLRVVRDRDAGEDLDASLEEIYGASSLAGGMF
jgi:hypothetical protein